MSADAIVEPVALTEPTESNTARKKKAKAEAAAKQANAATPSTPISDSAAHAEIDASNESQYIKDLQKQIRNITKKLNSMTKVDTIITENPDLSLDDLVTTKKINADQKAQALKKPALQSSLTQFEDQIAQYRKIDTEYQTRMSTEREILGSSHKNEIEQLKESLKKEAESEASATLRKKLLTFSQFLRAAAAKRVVEEEADTEESKAFEGALLLVYGGDDKAVDAAESLIEGAEEAVLSVEGHPLSVTYSQIKKLSIEHAPYPVGDDFAESVQDSAAMTQPAVESTTGAEDPLSDPTIAHAGLTELSAQTNGVPEAHESELKSPPQMSAGDEMSNNAGAGAGTEESEESFEIVPRPAEETETPHVPAAQNMTTSWADDAAAELPVVTSNGEPAPTEETWSQVEKRGANRGHRGDGPGHRGRGGRGRGGPHRGGERGRGGFRGERRGGGEGRGRGGRGGPRGQPAGGQPAA